MLEITDAKMVGELGRILDYPIERILWGQLEVAKKYWVRYLSAKKGVAELPYMSFFRTLRFHDTDKRTGQVDVVDYDDVIRKLTFVRVMLNYTVEVMTARVSEQNEVMKQFIIWAGKEASVGFKDNNGTDWRFRVIAEDPEDNSDLESEEDYGRMVRTTLSFQVDSLLFDRSGGETAPIHEILMNVKGYYDNIDKPFDILEEVVS